MPTQAPIWDFPEYLTRSPTEILGPLFNQARERDEFEFVCTLLRIRGLEGPGWDPLQESMALSSQLIALIQGPLEAHLKTRLMLFLYSHLLEMPDLHDVPCNLLRVVEGDRCSGWPFDELPKPTKNQVPAFPLNDQCRQLLAYSEHVGRPEIGRLFACICLRQVRNAFAHSNYGFTEKHFNIVDGDGLAVDGLIRHEIPWDWLWPRMNLGVNVARSIMDLMIEHARSYKVNRRVKGRFGPGDRWVDLELLTDPNWGLLGFRTLGVES